MSYLKNTQESSIFMKRKDTQDKLGLDWLKMDNLN